MQKEKISLFFPLKSAHLLELTSAIMRIGIEKELYFRELTRKESRSLLEEIAKRFGATIITRPTVKASDMPV